MISAVVFTVLAALVVYGVLDLRKSKFSSEHKTLILAVVGLLLSVSLLVSALKSTRHLTFSLLKSGSNDAERLFSELPEFSYKYSLPVSEKFNEIYYRTNYPHYTSITTNRKEKVVYVSSENEGASSFLFLLAKKLQSKRVPVLYLKLEADVYSEVDLLDKIGLHSLKNLEDMAQYWNQKGLTPYVIVDGIEHLVHCRQFLSTLARIFENNHVSFIGNTEERRVLETFFRVVSYETVSVKEWLPPSYQQLANLAPNSYSKRLPNNFQTVAQLKTASEEEILMKHSRHSRDLVHQLGMVDLVAEIAGKNLSLSLVKNRLPSEKLSKALELGVLKVKEGLVHVDNDAK